MDAQWHFISSSPLRRSFHTLRMCFHSILQENVSLKFSLLSLLHRDSLDHYLFDRLDSWETQVRNILSSFIPTVLSTLVLEYLTPESFHSFSEELNLSYEMFEEDFQLVTRWNGDVIGLLDLGGSERIERDERRQAKKKHREERKERKRMNLIDVK